VKVLLILLKTRLDNLLGVYTFNWAWKSTVYNNK